MATFTGILIMSNGFAGTTAADDITGGFYPDVLRGGDGRDTIDGGGGDDKLFGDDGNDLLIGGKGNDIIEGGADQDTLVGGDGDDILKGQGGNDVFRDTVGNNQMFGGDGVDTVDYSGLDVGSRVIVNLQTGSADHERIINVFTDTPGLTYERAELVDSDTLSLIENVIGSRGDDALTGDARMNVLRGGFGDDTITGGGGADQMSGGAGKDVFIFGNGDANVRVTDIFGVVTVDRITDFNFSEDTIDFSRIDADTTTAGNQKFHFANNFSGEAGELLIRQDSDVNFRIVGDTNGDGVGDVFVDLTMTEGVWSPGNFMFYSDANVSRDQATIWL